MDWARTIRGFDKTKPKSQSKDWHGVPSLLWGLSILTLEPGVGSAFP
jgi:hypothetical protein